jgi:hypothetical protein
MVGLEKFWSSPNHDGASGSGKRGVVTITGFTGLLKLNNLFDSLGLFHGKTFITLRGDHMALSNESKID